MIEVRLDVNEISYLLELVVEAWTYKRITKILNEEQQMKLYVALSEAKKLVKE